MVTGPRRICDAYFSLNGFVLLFSCLVALSENLAFARLYFRRF